MPHIYCTEQVGHIANDPALFNLLALPLLSEQLPRDGLLALRWRGAPSTPSVLLGVASVRCAGKVGTIDCLAVNVESLLSMDPGVALTVEEALDAMLAGCIEHAQDAGCRQLKIQAWIDDNIDDRGPLAEVKGSGRDAAAAMLAALNRARFHESGSEHGELDVMFGRPLGDGSPPLPELPELPAGYFAHPYRPEVDHGRWREAMLAIFPEPECQDPYFTAENLYTRRHDYAEDEVVMVECEGTSTAVGIGAGVAHSFEINTQTGTIVDGSSVGSGAVDSTATNGAYRIVYLDWIGVMPEHRGKRIGEYISVSCLKSLMDRGEQYCTLWTQLSRVAAIRLYERLGFVQIARVVALERSLM